MIGVMIGLLLIFSLVSAPFIHGQEISCPEPLTVQTVRNFAAFSHDINQLPADQRDGVNAVVARIITSHLPNCRPITEVLVEGYSDIVRDHPEWSEAQRLSKEDEVSKNRAAAVRTHIMGAVQAVKPDIISKIIFAEPVGHGRVDADPSKISENRRVVIVTDGKHIPPPKTKPNLDERADRALQLAQQNGLEPSICALTLFKQRRSGAVSLFYVDAQKPITIVKGLPPISLLWQGTECAGGELPRLCREQNYGTLNSTEIVAFTSNLVEDIKSTRFDPQRPDIEILDRLKEITTNAVRANQLLHAHLAQHAKGGADKGRIQLLALQNSSSKIPNDIHYCFFKQ